MTEVYSFDVRTLVDATERASLNLGPLSAAVAMHEILCGIDGQILPKEVEERLEGYVGFFSQILTLCERQQQYVTDRMTELVAQIRAEIARYDIVVCTSYESLLWDKVFEYTPDKLFLVVIENPSASPSRLNYYRSNVEPITINEVPMCAGRRNLLVTSSYGHVPGDPNSVYVPLHTRQILSASLHSPFNHHCHVSYIDCPVNQVPFGMTNHSLNGAVPA